MDWLTYNVYSEDFPDRCFETIDLTMNLSIKWNDFVLIKSPQNQELPLQNHPIKIKKNGKKCQITYKVEKVLLYYAG